MQGLYEMFKKVGNGPLLGYQEKSFPMYDLTKALTEEEESLKQTVTTIHATKFPANSKIISSYTILKIKVGENGKMKLKERTDPQWNEDTLIRHPRCDLYQCVTIGVRLILSMEVLLKWCISKVDVKSSFLQTGREELDFYVRPASERDQKHSTYLYSMLQPMYL